VSEHLDVVIVGAGLAGIGAACHLRDRLPHKSFAILEARDAIGGTWDLFRYPGVRSDSDHHTYGFSFAPWSDDETLASGEAILGYLQRVLDEHELAAHVRFGQRVMQVEWSTSRARWTVTTEDAQTGERSTLTCSWVFATTGYFRYDHGHEPVFPGAEQFRGALVYPQHWPVDLDVARKRVVVIGSGATAATLVPALAHDAEHVTMLQRSPSYYLPLPSHDPVARLLYRVLPRERAYAWTREKNRRIQALFHRVSRARPATMKQLLIKLTAKQLPEGYDVERHFVPEYAPWDQRVCFLPDGDLFRAIRAGRASVVTDTIDTFTERGVRLASGDELEADIVVSATGLDLLALGGIDTIVDGEHLAMGERVVYKSVMLSDVPNLAFVFGYTNASWTLKVDLAAEWFCRCLALMDRRGYSVARPVVQDAAMPRRRMLDLDAGYIRRAEAEFPQQGTGPWSVEMRYPTDARRLRRDPVEDGVLQLSRPLS
jgi:cation diffusion facilitator CzcD-associated flavoprotein CzcO